MPNKFTEGLQQTKDGRYKLREKIIIDENSIVARLPLQKLTESVQGQDLPIFGTYLVRIWIEKGLNKNRRNYSRVFPQLLKNKPITCGLMNHPEDDGDPRDIFAVFKNPVMRDGWLCVEMTLCGRPFGENTEAELRCGLALELSSSALGDVDREGFVLVEGFELERWGDKVFHPSNGLKQELSDIEILPPGPTKTEKQEETETSKIQEQIETEEILDSSQDLTIYEKTNRRQAMGTDVQKLQESIEKSLTRSVKAMLVEAEKETNLIEKRTLLEDVMDSAKDLVDKVYLAKAQTLLETVNQGILELAEKGKTVSTLEETIKTTSELSAQKVKEVDTLQESVKTIQEKYDTLVKLYEDKQYQASATELEINQALNDQIKLLRERYRKILEEKIYFEALSNTRIEAEPYLKLKEAFHKLKKENSTLQESVTQTRQELRGLKLKLVESRKKGFRSYRETEDEDKTPATRRRVRETEEIRETAPRFRDSEVKRFYESSVISNPDLEEWEDDFRACRSLREAQILKMEKTEREVEEVQRSAPTRKPQETSHREERIQEEVAPEQDYGETDFDRLLEAAHLVPEKAV